MDSNPLQQLVSQWHAGEIDWAMVEMHLRAVAASEVSPPDVRIDLDRDRRCGFPEVVFGTGKSPEAVVSVFRTQQAAGQNSLVTRVNDEQAQIILEEFPGANFNRFARTVSLIQSPQEFLGRVAVVTAGTSDRPVAEEAVETACWMGCDVDQIFDVGVAGPRRLLAEVGRLSRADAVVVVAGMEGALPSVVAGWVAVPVIAVPTSVGYGANFGGVSALLSMLNSCAANVAVVNIDAGFKGGYLASMIARRTTPHPS